MYGRNLVRARVLSLQAKRQRLEQSLKKGDVHPRLKMMMVKQVETLRKQLKG